MRDMCERQSDDADFSVWSPSGVPEVLRQDHPNGRVPEASTPQVCDLPCQDLAAEAEWRLQPLGCAQLGLSVLRRQLRAQLGVALLHDVGVFVSFR